MNKRLHASAKHYAYIRYTLYACLLLILIAAYFFWAQNERGKLRSSLRTYASSMNSLMHCIHTSTRIDRENYLFYSSMGPEYALFAALEGCGAYFANVNYMPGVEPWPKGKPRLFDVDPSNKKVLNSSVTYLNPEPGSLPIDKEIVIAVGSEADVCYLISAERHESQTNPLVWNTKFKLYSVDEKLDHDKLLGMAIQDLQHDSKLKLCSKLDGFNP